MIMTASVWEFKDGYPLSVIFIDDNLIGNGFTLPMIWTQNNYIYYISIAFIKNDDINQFQRLEKCNVRIWYIPYQ